MNSIVIKRISTDILVIGGGVAAIRGAFEADEQDANVLLVVKGNFCESGSTFYPLSPGWGMQASFGYADQHDSCNEHLKEVLNAGLGMCDQKLAEILVFEAPKRLIDLEKYGIAFKKVNGNYVQVTGCFSFRPRSFIAPDTNNIVIAFKNEIKKRNIQVIEKTMIISLLTHDKECVGAIGINEENAFIVIKAKSTIIATGGAGQLFLYNLATPDLTGDGYILALNAGAELLNMEFIQIGFGIVHPIKKGLFSERVLIYHPDIHNKNRQRFIEQYIPNDADYNKCLEVRSSHYPFSSRDESMYIDMAIYKEIKEGRGTEHGGVYVDFTDIPKEEIVNDPLINEWYNWLLSNGVDICKQPIEIAPHTHAFNGGIKINEKGETALTGLYACGEVAGGPHGADRLGGNMIAATQVFGARAGKYAAERAKDIKEVIINEEQVKNEYETMLQIMNQKTGYKPGEVLMKIQKVMWDNVLVSRNEKGLKGCIRELQQIWEEELLNLFIENNGRLSEIFEIRNLLQLGQIVANAALIREESRGSHYRSDFSYRDNEHFSKSILIKKEGSQIKYRLEDIV